MKKTSSGRARSWHSESAGAKSIPLEWCGLFRPDLRCRRAPAHLTRRSNADCLRQSCPRSSVFVGESSAPPLALEHFHPLPWRVLRTSDFARFLGVKHSSPDWKDAGGWPLDLMPTCRNLIRLKSLESVLFLEGLVPPCPRHQKSKVPTRLFHCVSMFGLEWTELEVVDAVVKPSNGSWKVWSGFVRNLSKILLDTDNFIFFNGHVGGVYPMFRLKYVLFLLYHRISASEINHHNLGDLGLSGAKRLMVGKSPWNITSYPIVADEYIRSHT